MIDTHCHLDSDRFQPDRDEVISRAFAAGVRGIVVPAIGPDRWERLLQWPRRLAQIQIGLGIHPQLLPELPESQDERHLARLDELLAQGGSSAVGECGLDGPSVPAGASMERQLRVLERHLELARRHGLPVLLHCLRAHKELIALLKRVPFPEAGVVMHSYSGGADQVRFYAGRGCHFSFAGPVTFEDARRPLDAARAVPADRLLLETDAPDQAPHPHRGGRSEPAYLPLIAAALARARGEEAGALAEATTRNALALFPALAR
ncbi:MAG TPA: TatD family hydrolase [Myxococcales bacterium]|nr:TatD family hydrolase [Myxococcales bacterium]